MDKTDRACCVPHDSQNPHPSRCVKLQVPCLITGFKELSRCTVESSVTIATLDTGKRTWIPSRRRGTMCTRWKPCSHLEVISSESRRCPKRVALGCLDLCVVSLLKLSSRSHLPLHTCCDSVTIMVDAQRLSQQLNHSRPHPQPSTFTRVLHRKR